MRARWLFVLFTLLTTGYLPCASAVLPTDDEMTEAQRWTAAAFAGGSTAKPVFSFMYDGKPVDELLAACAFKQGEHKLNDQRTERTLTWADSKTGFEVRCVSVAYADFPVVEWTVYLRNAGTADTPLIENIQALDTRWERSDGGEFVLRGIKGDYCVPDSYEPYEMTLGPNATQKFAPEGGRPTNKAFPGYNLAIPGGGVILAVGWPGQWAAIFTRDGDSVRSAAFRLSEVEQAKACTTNRSGAVSDDHRVWGTYLHGIFDADGFRRWFIDRLRVAKGLAPVGELSHYDIEPALERLAAAVRASVDIKAIYRLMGL
jgi:hypothetical protein